MSMNDTHSAHSVRRNLETFGSNFRDYVLAEPRHSGLIRFLDERLDPTSRDTAVDIGCGSGVISRGLSGKFTKVIGIDRNPDNAVLSGQLTEEAGLLNIRYEHGYATQLPIADGVADLAVLNGVLEWAGANDKGEDPQSVQLQVLREVMRILKPSGVLYIGIENRWHPRTLLVDPHTHLPLVNALPRSFANIVSRSVRNVPFQAYIYGHRALRRMLTAAGFAAVDVFVPFPGYKLPCHYIPLRDRKAMLGAIDEIDIPAVEAITQQTHVQIDVGRAVARLRRRVRLGLVGLFAHDFAILAAKH